MGDSYHTDFVGVTDQLVGRILEEMDYRNEAAYAHKFGELYRSRAVRVAGMRARSLKRLAEKAGRRLLAHCRVCPTLCLFVFVLRSWPSTGAAARARAAP